MCPALNISDGEFPRASGLACTHLPRFLMSVSESPPFSPLSALRSQIPSSVSSCFPAGVRVFWGHIRGPVLPLHGQAPLGTGEKGRTPSYIPEGACSWQEGCWRGSPAAALLFTPIPRFPTAPRFLRIGFVSDAAFPLFTLGEDMCVSTCSLKG